MTSVTGTVVLLLIVMQPWLTSDASRQTSSTAIRYRFHHIHVSVDDPAAGMNAASSSLGATRTLLQGHGVAVRSSGQYLVFDREDSNSSRTPDPHNDPASVYLEAVRWLIDRGGATEPLAFTNTAFAGGITANRINAIAFSTENLTKAAAALSDRGVQPFERTTETVRFRLPSKTVLEIIRETDRPDAYWCPMHPDVRTSHPGKCPLCGMALVPIPLQSLGEYRLDATMTPRRDTAGHSSLRLVVRDPKSNQTVRKFVEVHERLLHLFVVNRTLERFAHFHPEQQKDGTFEMLWDLPADEYVLIADFLPAAGAPQMVHRVVITPGYKGPLFAPPLELKANSNDQVVGGLKIRLETDALLPFRPSNLRFTFFDAETNSPISDLEPFLGASGHLLLVSPDLTTAIHGHPEGMPSLGPAIAFAPLIGAPGRYKLWVQVQRGGKVVTAAFVIDVRMGAK